MNKSDFRQIFLEKRISLSTDEVAAKNGQIADRFFSSTNLKTIKVLHTFIPIARHNEIDSSKIYGRIWAEFPSIKTAAPHTNFATGELESRTFDATMQFFKNSWGISEPVNGELVDPTEIDIVLVPLLCFDLKGQRVGYGKGFYDRFLVRCRPDCLKVGLSLFPPVEEIGDAGQYDVPLDRCITPIETYSFTHENASSDH